MRPRLLWSLDAATGAQVCAGRSRSGKRNGGMGRNEMLFLRLQSFAVLGRIMVWAVLGVDFIQASLHTSR